MPKGPLLLASLGLALSLFLRGVPAMVAAADAAHLVLPNNTPTISQALDSLERNSGQTPSLEDALIKLIGAESEALQVAGEGLQQPAPNDLAPRANAAGARVEDAAATYARAAQALLNR
jgi:hypothetical protein